MTFDPARGRSFYTVFDDYTNRFHQLPVQIIIVMLTNWFPLCFQVSLDSRVREIINRNMVEPTPNTFDDAQLQIYTLMHRDSYPRFLKSQYFKQLVQQVS